ncbi:hypothetical protein PV327_003321 [Microctonus hyperodae]|uniref:tRNA-splicing endonuclease subunit Sen15 domain-containing protein n=1 Tax=Microctonus hyperodae TaxID=165561 RepID=A0AA39G3T9_MICHY|nr:hypothetical protein PV327_003321 [Microctonus hyperodae]
MDYICHPSYYKIKELGCKNELKIATAFYVYIELCEDRRLWDVEYKYESELDLIYFTAKKCKNTPTNLYIPWPANNKIQPRIFENIQNKLNCTHFTLVVKSGEGTSVFVVVNRGMKKPLAPHEVVEKREERKRKLLLERDIKRNSRNLYELAKSNDEENN